MINLHNIIVVSCGSHGCAALLFGWRNITGTLMQEQDNYLLSPYILGFSCRGVLE
jgi:hypothetical protein